jgi:hypothetical protein
MFRIKIGPFELELDYAGLVILFLIIAVIMYNK